MLTFTKTIRKMQNGRMRYFIEAICDSCGEVREVRRDWAVDRYKAKGKAYTCKACSSAANLLLAREAQEGTELEQQFVKLCCDVYTKGLDDKDPEHICAVLNTDERHLVELARDMAEKYVRWSEGRQADMPSEVIQVANYKESGTLEALDLYSLEDQLRGAAFLALEVLPVPEWLIEQK